MELVSPSSPATVPDKSDSEITPPSSNPVAESTLLSSKSTETPFPSSIQPPQSSSSPAVAENTNPNPNLVSLQPQSIPSISPPPIPGGPPSFRPAPGAALQFSPLLPNPTLQPPGVASSGPVSIMLPGAATGAGAVTVSVSPIRPTGVYPYTPAAPPLNPPPYAQMHNGYAPMPGTAPIPPPVSSSLITVRKIQQATSWGS